MKRSRWIGLLMSAVLCFGTVFPMSACNSAKDGEDDQTGGETEEPYIPEELESNGIALENYQIVISAEASAAERYAAEVLQENFRKAGQSVPEVVTDDEAETEYEILIGQTERKEDDGIDYSSLGDESYVVKTAGNDLVIAANEKRGAIYGVYAYLDALGFRYYTPDCEKIPEKEDVFVAKDVDLQWNPTFIYRESMAESTWDSEWALTQCINSDFKRDGLKTNERYGGSMGFSGGDRYLVHTLQYLLPDSVYSEHPEYFSEIDGKRSVQQPCFTSEGGLEYVYQSARKLLLSDNTGLLNISQRDGGKECECANCRASYEKYGIMGTILNYINKIAEKLEGEFPDVLVQTLCYEWSCELPKGGVVPRDNVIVELCLNMCKDHLCDDADCEIVEETMGLLRGWSEITDQLYIWSYPGSWADSFRVRGGFKSYWSQANAFAENNVVAHYAEITGVECPEFSEWRAYLWAKLNKNPSMSYAEYRYHMEDFAYGYYGDSAEYILEYVDYIESLKVGTHEDIMKRVPVTIVNGKTQYDMTVFDRCNELWDEAEAVATEETLPHVEKSRLHLTMTELLNTGTKRYQTASEEEREVLVERNEALYKDIFKYGCIHKFPEHTFNPNITDFRLFPEKW